ncbi:hypothetical protein FH972_023660 [Carpinus fangiana]|uniref:Uncharacterized protein n=1 Tax=Carpinus fangiana TaxID=176857 RepID=A0A5N6KVU7_9ROSI|nr:hypothetical protein FH972_023660 [Carpinus fangiana]
MQEALLTLGRGTPILVGKTTFEDLQRFRGASRSPSRGHDAARGWKKHVRKGLMPVRIDKGVEPKLCSPQSWQGGCSGYAEMQEDETRDDGNFGGANHSIAYGGTCGNILLVTSHGSPADCRLARAGSKFRGQGHDESTQSARHAILEVVRVLLVRPSSPSRSAWVELSRLTSGRTLTTTWTGGRKMHVSANGRAGELAKFARLASLEEAEGGKCGGKWAKIAVCGEAASCSARPDANSRHKMARACPVARTLKQVPSAARAPASGQAFVQLRNLPGPAALGASLEPIRCPGSPYSRSQPPLDRAPTCCCIRASGYDAAGASSAALIAPRPRKSLQPPPTFFLPVGFRSHQDPSTRLSSWPFRPSALLACSLSSPSLVPRSSSRQDQNQSGRSSRFSLSRKSSLASIKDAVSGQSSAQSSAYTSTYTSAYNSRPASALMQHRHTESYGDVPDSPASLVSAKAASLLGFAPAQPAEQHPATVKPWFKRGRRLRRKASQASMVSEAPTDHDDSSSLRRDSSSQVRQGKNTASHITHTKPMHFSRMNKSSSQNDLLAEFSAIRASQVPARALRGIKAGEIHSRSPSLDAGFHSFAPSLVSKGSHESLASSGLSSPVSMQSPRLGQFQDTVGSPTHRVRRVRHAPANIPLWSATRISMHGYPGQDRGELSPASPLHVRPEDIGVALPLEEHDGWHQQDNQYYPPLPEDREGGFHAVSTPDETAWELGPNSTLPFELLPSLNEEDESALSRPASSVNVDARNSVIHRGPDGKTVRISAVRASAFDRIPIQEDTYSGIPMYTHEEPDRVVSVIHHPATEPAAAPPAESSAGLFSSWHAGSDTSSVADGEALLESIASQDHNDKIVRAAPSPSIGASSWRDSQATTLPYSGQDDYTALLDDIISPEAKCATWIEDSPRAKSKRRSQDEAARSHASAYPMSPDDSDEGPSFDPHTAPLPRRPDSVVVPRPERVSAGTSAPSIRSTRTTSSIISSKDKPKRTSSTSKKVAFAEAAGGSDSKRKSPASKIPRPTHQRGASNSSTVSAPDSPYREPTSSWSTAAAEESERQQRHSTGQVRKSKAGSHSRKTSSTAEKPHRRSSKRTSGGSMTTTATNAGYSNETKNRAGREAGVRQRSCRQVQSRVKLAGNRMCGEDGNRLFFCNRGTTAGHSVSTYAWAWRRGTAAIGCWLCVDAGGREGAAVVLADDFVLFSPTRARPPQEPHTTLLHSPASASLQPIKHVQACRIFSKAVGSRSKRRPSANGSTRNSPRGALQLKIWWRICRAGSSSSTFSRSSAASRSAAMPRSPSYGCRSLRMPTLHSTTSGARAYSSQTSAPRTLSTATARSSSASYGRSSCASPSARSTPRA